MTFYVLQQYVLQHIKTVLIEESDQSTRIRKNCSQFLQSNRRIDSLDFPIESKSAGLDDFIFHDLILFRIIALQEIIWAGQAFMKGSQGISGQIWPLFFTAIYYLIFNGILTVVLGKLEKKLDYFR